MFVSLRNAATLWRCSYVAVLTPPIMTAHKTSALPLLYPTLLSTFHSGERPNSSDGSYRKYALSHIAPGL
jgi:hypothetical protein